MKSLIFRKCQNVNVIDLDDEGVIYKEKSIDEKFIANTTAMAIWDLLNGRRTSLEIAQEIANACGVKIEEVETDVYNQLTKFMELGFVEEKKD
jgi:hypothetical protein